ncbi:MAG: FtsX-like permease family protein [Phycisphaerales bacterium]
MYHALLTNRYLTTRVIPFIAVAAVALCTALVIIVVSVMSGFVDMVRNAGKTLMGDVIISYPIDGIPHYETLLERIAALKKEVEAAAPLIDAYGLLSMPYGSSREVQAWGIEPRSFNAVTGYAETLYWKPIDDRTWLQALANITEEIWASRDVLMSPSVIAEAEAATSETLRRVLFSIAETPEAAQAVLTLPQARMRAELPEILGERWRFLLYREPRLEPDLALYEKFGQELDVGGERGEAAVLGIHVSEGNRRRSDGSYRVLDSGNLWMPLHTVTLTVAPVRDGNIADPESHIFAVANEAQFGVFQIDERRILIPLHIAQQMLDMDEAQTIDPNQIDENGMPLVIGSSPARVTHILVSGTGNVSLAELKRRIEAVYDTLSEELLNGGNATLLPSRETRVQIKTWEEQNAQIIGPVEKERNLMRILFSIIYFVCAGLVLVIFWAIVYEKTRDIGILRAVGASRAGILYIFVRYGLIVGIIGSVGGLGLAYVVVRNINTIHNILGEPFPLWAWGSMLIVTLIMILLLVWMIRRDALLPIVALAILAITCAGITIAMLLHKGFLVWDPKVYYFTTIPNSLDLRSAIVTMSGAVIFSVIGALIPAARAADIDPVSALRYE